MSYFVSYANLIHQIFYYDIRMIYYMILRSRIFNFLYVPRANNFMSVPPCTKITLNLLLSFIILAS